jgi:tRNA threonylcarbamoyladenosine biosynthesis protein TsaB
VIILAIDTASAVGGVGLLADDRLLAAGELGPAGGQAERILAAVDERLLDADLRAGEIGLVAVASGPGSFTGLRVGMAAGQGLALGLGIPVIGVPSLSVLALWAREVREETGHLWCGVIDARRGEVFLAGHASDPSDPRALLERLAPGLVEPGRLWDILAPAVAGAGDGAPVVFCGDGVPVLASELVAAPRPIRTVSPPRPPDAVTLVGRLGRRAFLRDGAPALLEPLYIRPPDARKPGDRC